MLLEQRDEAACLLLRLRLLGEAVASNGCVATDLPDEAVLAGLGHHSCLGYRALVLLSTRILFE